MGLMGPGFSLARINKSGALGKHVVVHILEPQLLRLKHFIGSLCVLFLNI